MFYSEGGIYIYFMSTCKYQLPRMLTYDTRNGGTSHFTHILYHPFNAFSKWWLWCLENHVIGCIFSFCTHINIHFFFHLFHSFSRAINYLHITCKGFHYRRKFARNDTYWLLKKHFFMLTIWINVWFTKSQFIWVRWSS